MELRELLSRKSGGASACALYREELCKLVKEGVAESLAERLQDKVAIGSEEFKQRIKTLIREGGREYTHKRESRSRCAFEKVVCAVEELKAEKWEDFQGQRGDWGKGLVLWGVRQFSGLTLAQIGRKAGGMDYTAVAMAMTRF